jgi:hypothetical protein
MEKERMRDLLYNLNELNQIALFKEDWNGNGAKVFDAQLICKVKRIRTSLEWQPEVFLTANDSIQLEYEIEDSSCLEIEVSKQDFCQVFEIDADGQETCFSMKADIEAIHMIVNRFV